MNNIDPNLGIKYVNPEAAVDPQLVALRDRLGRTVAEAIQEISKTSFEARATYKDNAKVLDTAVWYPAQYLAALGEAGQKKRLAYFEENHFASMGFAPEKYFKRGKDNFEFIVKNDVPPSEAILHITDGPTLLDCGTVIQIARYRALLNVLGEAKFNRLFGKPQGEKMNVCFIDNRRQPMRYFVNFTAASYLASTVFRESGRRLDNHEDLVAFSKDVNHVSVGKLGKRPIKLGQVVSFNNVPNAQYRLKHPFGMSSNYNVVCVDETEGNQKFCAHGIPAEGCTEEEINQFLATTYNDDDTQTEEMRASHENPLHLAAIEQSKLFKGHHVTEEQVLGYDAGSPQDFNLRLIQDLIELPLEKVNIDFVRNHPEAKRAINDIESSSAH